MKILILEIKDGGFLSFWSFRNKLYPRFTRPKFYLNYWNIMIKVTWIILASLFLFGVWIFISKRKHLLAMLLSLEFIVLSLYLLLFSYLTLLESEEYFRIVFLTFAVCEGALGLAILVSMIRTHGNDHFQSFNVLQC